MNETLQVLGRSLCRPCAETEAEGHDEEALANGGVVRQVDPTVCAQCGADNGEGELPLISQLPVCRQCEDSLRNRPYPAWLKLSFAALVALAIFSLAWNWRFWAAYREMQQMQRAMRSSKFDDAAALAEAAARHVPEVPELAAVADFNRGIVLLTNDQSAEAVQAFGKARQGGRQMGPVLDQMTLRAEAGAAFDRKDYDEFLAKMQAYAASAPGDQYAVAGVASAYACKYAVGGAEEDRDLALKNLDDAAKLAHSNVPDFQDFRDRIEHRLETREIMKQKEFQRRFPSGYKKGTAP